MNKKESLQDGYLQEASLQNQPTQNSESDLEDFLTTDFAKAVAACLTYFEGESFPYLEFLEGGDKNDSNIEYEWKLLKEKQLH